MTKVLIGLIIIIFLPACESGCYKVSEGYVFEGFTVDGHEAASSGWESEESLLWGTGTLWLGRGETSVVVEVNHLSIYAEIP